MSKIINTITVDVVPTNWWQRYRIRKGKIPGKRTYVIQTPKTITLQKIVNRLVDAPESILKPGRTVDDVIVKMYKTYLNDLIYVIARSIQNDGEKLSEKLVNRIIREFTAEEIYSTATIIFNSLPHEEFIKVLIAYKGRDILYPKREEPSMYDKLGINILLHQKNIAFTPGQDLSPLKEAKPATHPSNIKIEFNKGR